MNTKKQLRILIVEDQLTDRTVAIRVLQSMGYTADLAVNGLEALQALHQKHYDVLLTDVQMPQMGGLEVARQICQQWTLKERPCIIAVTSEPMSEVREQCLNVGMDECLSKPINVNELVQALRKCRCCSHCDE
jgi:CheY-like chemotaxis protein